MNKRGEGYYKKGEERGIAIRKLIAEGKRQVDIAKELNLSISVV